MKKSQIVINIVLLICVFFLNSNTSYANLEFSGEKYLVAQSKTKKIRRKSRSSGLSSAIRLVKEKKYEEASVKLFKLSNSYKYRNKKARIKFLTGLMLYKMKLYQVAAFQFISVIKSGNSRYLNKSLEKLSLAADQLSDDTLLNYAVSKVNLNSFPKEQRDVLYFRIGEIQLRSKKYRSAANNFARVSPKSKYYSESKYNEGMAYAHLKKNKSAVRTFNTLIDARNSELAPANDLSKVSGIMGKARVYYQNKSWTKAIEYYRQIPRDTQAWHDTLFESSWAMLRSGKFRSALSNFQSLHSPYYEDFYLPESLLLRSIVYLYICKYDEMEKVLNLFDRLYKPTFTKIKRYTASSKRPETYFKDIDKVIKDFEKKGEKKIKRNNYRIPYVAAKKIEKEGDFNRSYKYISKLEAEIAKVKTGKIKNTSLGRYSLKILNRRLKKAKQKAGKQVRLHLISMRSEIFDLFEQSEFVRYEMLNSKKEVLKKKVSGKDISETQVDDDKNRNFYIQNGYEYWPFDGEYWLDELGNYHYVGTQSCK